MVYFNYYYFMILNLLGQTDETNNNPVSSDVRILQNTSCTHNFDPKPELYDSGKEVDFCDRILYVQGEYI
jgi:hypothetical protein